MRPLVFHVRKIMLYPELEGQDSPSTRYLNKQGMTFAFEEREDGWWVAWSRTSHRDSFCRKIGRLVAVGKLTCKRKTLAEYFGHQAPTFEDCVVMYSLDDSARFETYLTTGRWADTVTPKIQRQLNNWLINEAANYP